MLDIMFMCNMYMVPQQGALDLNVFYIHKYSVHLTVVASYVILNQDHQLSGSEEDFKGV